MGSKLHKRALLLSYFTVGYNVIEGIVSIVVNPVNDIPFSDAGEDLQVNENQIKAKLFSLGVLNFLVELGKQRGQSWSQLCVIWKAFDLCDNRAISARNHQRERREPPCLGTSI